MRTNNGSLKFQSFIYDFSVDGGGISIKPMGIFIPVGSVLGNYSCKTIIPLASAGAAVVNIGLVGRPLAIFPNAIIGANTGDFNDYNGTIFSDFLSRSPNSYEWGIPLASSLEVTVQIAAAALTGGKFIFTINYKEFQ